MDRAAARTRLSAALSETQRPHPLVSAMQFLDMTNQINPDDTQGASLDVKTGRLLKAGEHDAWMVGGHKNNAGVKIPEEPIPGRSINFTQALNHVQRVAAQTRGQRGTVAAGSWYTPEKNHLALDASTSVENRDEAVDLMRSRREDAIFHLKTFEQINNPDKVKR